jgi:ankyrin repeat protein
MYIYLIDNKVYLTIPIIAGSDIATDNTCKTFQVLKNYIDNVQTELDFFGNLFELLGTNYNNHREQIQQYKNIVESLRQQGAFSGLQKDNYNTRELKEFLNQSNSMVLDSQTNRDNFLKSSKPTFSLKHKSLGQEEVSESILGIKLREAITNIKSIKLDTPSIDNFKEALPDIDINYEAPLERCKEAWLQAGFTERQWTDAGGALAERINQMLTIKEEDDEIFDKDQLCGALDSIWAIIAQNQVSFNSLANDIFTSTERREVKIDKIAVLTQFFLGNINIYLKDIDSETINLGEIFDSSEELSHSLAATMQESLTRGDNTDDVIINFIHENILSLNLSEEQKQEVKKLFINRYRTIQDSRHFDEFFILPKDTNNPWFSYGGAFSLELTQFASKFQVTKDKFKDFIDSRNFNEVTREDDNSLPNINFIDHFDLDNKDIILNQNNFNILERLTNTKYKPTRHIYDKITYKIKVDHIDSNIAQKILSIAISKNNIELLKTAVDRGANIDIKDKDGHTPLHWAAYKNNHETALALINKDANLDIQNITGKSPIHLAIEKGNNEIALALINKDANLDIQNIIGKSPLHWAIQKGNTEIALALINKGANLDIQDKTGKSPLHWAIYENNTEIALALINKGANLDIQEGWLVTRNPLHAAIISNRAEIVIALIEKGANVNAKNIFGETPLDLACKSNNEEIMKALIEKGAKGNNMNKVALLVTSIISIIATISLLITAILLPPLSIILFGCAGATGLSSIILLDSYFKSPAYIEIKAPSLQSLNQNEIQKGRMTTLNGEKNKNNPELSSSHNNNPHQ